MKYNVWKAIAYEITNLLIAHDARWEASKWVWVIRAHCFPDWVEWKTERTMELVDSEIEKFHEAAEQQEYEQFIKPTITEQPADGSKAQELLGGEIRITAPWVSRDDQG